MNSFDALASFERIKDGGTMSFLQQEGSRSIDSSGHSGIADVSWN